MTSNLTKTICDKGWEIFQGLGKERQICLPDALVNEVLKRNLDKISAAAGVEFSQIALASGKESFSLEGCIVRMGIQVTISIRMLPSVITWHANNHVVCFEILGKSYSIHKSSARSMLVAFVMAMIKGLTGKDLFDAQLRSLGNGDGSMAFCLDGVSRSLDLALKALNLRKIEPGDGGIIVTFAIGL